MGYTQEEISQAVINAINTAIASDALQNMTFKTFSDCDTDSTLNDIEFCDDLSAEYSYSEDSVNQACIDTLQATLDAALAVCDATRMTCNTGCDAVKVGYDACIGTCDAWRQTCKSGCAAVDWTCGGCCSDECQRESDSCKRGCGDAFPYEACKNDCNEMSEICKNGAQAAFDAGIAGCDVLTITGGAEAGLDRVNGCGNIQVTSVPAFMVSADGKQYRMDLTCVLPLVEAHAHYKLWQDPIPALTGTDTVTAKNTTATMSGLLTVVCEGDASGKAPGYYFNIVSLVINVPTDVSDSSGLFELCESIGLDIKYLTNCQVDLNKQLFDWVNSFLSEMVKDILNDVLADMSVLTATC